MKRMILAVVFVVVALAVASAIHFDGELRAVTPALTAAIRGSETWYTQPILASRADDARAVYVVTPALPSGDAFAAIRIDTSTGEQTATTVTLGPQAPYRAFMPAEARAEMRGLRFGRPALHLFTVPDGKGPGFHRVDSATGRMAVTAGGRPILTRNVFNSSTTPELLSLITADPNGRWLAALTRAEGGWKLFLFSSN